MPVFINEQTLNTIAYCIVKDVLCYLPINKMIIFLWMIFEEFLLLADFWLKPKISIIYLIQIYIHKCLITIQFKRFVRFKTKFNFNTFSAICNKWEYECTK